MNLNPPSGIGLRCLLRARLLFALAPRSVSALPQTGEQALRDVREVTFRYVAGEAATTSVNVAGTFNNWNKAANALTKCDDGKTWTLTLPLEPGLYQYKFVLNGDKWIADPAAPQQNDGNGNVNSILTLVPKSYETLLGVVGDGLLTTDVMRHEVSSRYVRRMNANHLELRLRTRAHDVAKVNVIEDEARPGAAKPQTLRRFDPMQRESHDELYDWWRAEIAIPSSGKLAYAFALTDGSRQVFYDSRGALRTPALQRAPHWFDINARDFPVFETPDWVRDAVFYQIFPERFANGDTANDGPNVVSWGTKPTFDNRMGGDLQGVIQHLDYLDTLGVNALYFNPIFTSRSNHGYDTTDYHTVDPRFGSNAVLQTLLNAMHRRGGHVVLDGVFNHSSVDFAPFADLRTRGASSPYRNWYYIKGFLLEVRDGQTHYEGWWGSPWLPKLNVNNPDTRAYLLDVARRWLRSKDNLDGIDGWRLDAANEIDHAYWKEFRKTVKKVNPNAYVVGEIWDNARDWLQGDEFDSVMNYRFRFAALDFFANDKTTPTQFEANLARVRGDYPPAVAPVLFNIVDSHDTERIATTCKGDWNRERALLLFQFAYPGVPVIYYGDEIGMTGGPDPDNRRAFPWDKAQWNTTTLAFYRQVIACRKRHAVLRRGDVTPLIVDDKKGVYGFARHYSSGNANEMAVALFNRSDETREVELEANRVGRETLQAWVGENVTVKQTKAGYRVTLPPRGCVLLGR